MLIICGVLDESMRELWTGGYLNGLNELNNAKPQRGLMLFQLITRAAGPECGLDLKLDDGSGMSARPSRSTAGLVMASSAIYGISNNSMTVQFARRRQLFLRPCLVSLKLVSRSKNDGNLTGYPTRCSYVFVHSPRLLNASPRRGWLVPYITSCSTRPPAKPCPIRYPYRIVRGHKYGTVREG